jgi:hypothetical protein
MKISPAESGAKPAMAPRRVDLPQPDGPSTATNSPGPTSRLMSCTAATALVPEPNETSTLRIRIAPRVPVKEEELLILQRRPDDAMACTSCRSV